MTAFKYSMLIRRNLSQLRLLSNHPITSLIASHLEHAAVRDNEVPRCTHSGLRVLQTAQL